MEDKKSVSVCKIKCVCCGIKRVNGAGQASYGEADVGTYCPGLQRCTLERWTDVQQTDRRGEEEQGAGGGAGAADRR